MNRPKEGISKFFTMPDYEFDDGKQVLYGVKEDLQLSGYRLLAEVPDRFEQVQVDVSRTCIF